MPTCPHCGADNKPGRRACWNCWTPLTGAEQLVLPAPDPAPPTVAADPIPPSEILPERAETADVPPAVDEESAEEIALVEEADTPAVAPPPDEPASPSPTEDDADFDIPPPIAEEHAVEELTPPEDDEPVEAPIPPEPLDMPAEATPIADEEPDTPQPETPADPAPAETLPGEEQEPGPPRDEDGHHHAPTEDEPLIPHTFTYVGGATAGAGRRGITWLLVVTFLLGALLLGAMVYWYVTARPAPRAESAGEVGRAYLTALMVGDLITQPQLATRDSSDLRLPSWMTIVSARPDGRAAVDGDTATLPCVCVFTLAPRDDPAPVALTSALALPYPLELPLTREGGQWRVDQQAFFTAIRDALQTKNPAVTFPAWE